ncbi:MAG: two-component system VirA-like sensor kinase [Gemmatimonas sp.]
MRAVPATAIVVLLVALLTWFLSRAFNPEAELFDHALAELDRFGMIENALSRDIFTARAGMLRNYDPFVHETKALRASLQRLRETCAIDDESTIAIDRLALTLDRQEPLVELFKSENALLHNSLSFFGRLGANPAASDLDPAISATAAAILHLSLDTSPSAVSDVEDRLDELDRQARRSGDAERVEALLAHGRLLHRLLPSVDGTLKAIRALPEKRGEAALRRLVLARQIKSRDTARWFRFALYGTSLALVAFLVHLGTRLKSHADTLRRRAALEHVIAGISMRFINASPQTIEGEIDRALADLAAHCAADRAYFVISGANARLHVWHKPGMDPPPGWPVRAPELASRIGSSDGVIHVPRVGRLPDGEAKASCLDFGLGGWACATAIDNQGVNVALGFDAVGRPCSVSHAGELALLRMALDTFVQAAERRTMESERVRLEARLQQARRMEKIGIFTSGIAHNFNNILGGILGHSEVMEEHVGSDAKLLRNLGAIRRGAERARDLVDQILAFGRRRETGRRPLDVGALVAETASLLEASLPAGIELVVRQQPGATAVSGESAQLQQVILNLCNNAVHAMPDGGRIEVATDLHDVPPSRPLSHDAIKPGAYVCIVVTDTGRGMEETVLARIFEPFFTTRSTGNGLGLATVRQIVHEHDGTVNVRSRPGEGTRFEVWLPRLTAETVSEPGIRALPTGEGQTVMIVALDEERVLRDEETLAALGYEPVGFGAVEPALAACRADPARFDIAIISQLGSVERSLELAAELHATAAHLPIVLAGKGAIEIAADTLVGAGIADIVRWPLAAEEIAVALAHCMAARRAAASPRRPALIAPWPAD